MVMDELGSGTDPAEGMGIAVAILEELKKSGALYLVTTHYPEIKAYAEKEEGVANARMTFDRENLRPLYQMVIGEAGESCAFYIAGRLGMPASMLRRAARAAYEGRCVPGKNTAGEMDALKENILGSDGVLGEDLAGICLSEELEKEAAPRIIRAQEGTTKKRGGSEYGRGDSVMVLPDKKIGIVCREATEKGVLQVQLPGKKIWINHKRVKLLVAAEKLYPEDYDFSIIFDTVENRKLRHQMERKYVQGEMIESEDGPA